MRWCGFLLATALCGLVAAQRPSPGRSDLFYTTRPDAWIVVRKHSMGPDLVEISMQDPKYPLPTLTSQVQSLGTYLGQSPWGVRVFTFSANPTNPDMTFVRASFAVNGLIDEQARTFRLAPLVQAMLGAPKGHEVNALDVVFEGEHPGPQTLSSYSDPFVKVQGQADPGRIGLEYRIQILTQDPAKIRIPDASAPRPAAAAPKAAGGGMAWWFWVVLGVVSLGIGALVYSLLLRLPASRAR